MIFKNIFPELSRTLSFNFQNFPGPKWFSGTLHILEFSRKNPRRGNPANSLVLDLRFELCCPDHEKLKVVYSS